MEENEETGLQHMEANSLETKSLRLCRGSHVHGMYVDAKPSTAVIYNGMLLKPLIVAQSLACSKVRELMARSLLREQL